jgi:hypothetical protein
MQTQPKIIELRRDFDNNQSWETASPLISEVLKIRRDFNEAMELNDYVAAVNLAIPLAIVSNEDRDCSRLEKALNTLRTKDYASFNDIISGIPWELAMEFKAANPMATALKILNEIMDYHKNHEARKHACLSKNDLMGLLDAFRFESFCAPKLPLWNKESGARLLIRENKKLVNRNYDSPLGLGWWICFSRMFHCLPVATVIDCPKPLTELFKANFPYLIFTQEYSDRDFDFEADPLVLPSILGNFPKDKYFNYPELNPKKGKIGFALGDRKRINAIDVVKNLPVDCEDIVDLEDDDLIKKGFLATVNEIATCSFVIGADCPVTHLAGALGVPSAIVLAKYHDARFGRAASGDRETLYKSQSVIMSSTN